jgi:hypothetical protein
MNIIDKVIQEWSFKTKKGYPDINSKEDMDLFESMFGFRLDEDERENNQVTVDQLIDLLNNKKASLDSEFISKLYHTVNNKGLKLGTFISNKLEKKGLTGTKNEIFSLINKYAGLEKDLAEFLKDESRQLTVSDLRANDNIVSLAVNKTKLPGKFLEELRYAGRSSEGGKGVGEGEAFLAVLGKDGKKLKVGDVSIDGKEIEVKGKGGRLIGRNENLKDFYKELEDIDQDIVTSREGVSGYVLNIFNKYRNTESEGTIRKTLNNILNKYFPNSIKADLSSRMSIRRKMLDWYVNSFLDGEAKNVEYIAFFIGSKFKIYSKEEFKTAIINGNIQTQNFTKSNKSPQLTGFSL